MVQLNEFFIRRTMESLVGLYMNMFNSISMHHSLKVGPMILWIQHSQKYSRLADPSHLILTYQLVIMEKRTTGAIQKKGQRLDNKGTLIWKIKHRLWYVSSVHKQELLFPELQTHTELDKSGYTTDMVHHIHQPISNLYLMLLIKDYIPLETTRFQADLFNQ